MLYLLSIVVFFLIFSTIILIHECGHFFSARRHGVHVHEFGLGIPPKAGVIATDKQGCEYTLNWIPFGGFVRLEGEDPTIKVKDKNKAFYSKSILARMEIVLAGVFMNFVLAIGIFTLIFSFGARPIMMSAEEVKSYVDQGVVEFEEGLKVTGFIEESIAQDGGVETGDVLLSVNNKPIHYIQEVLDIQETATEPVLYVFRRIGYEGLEEGESAKDLTDEEKAQREIITTFEVFFDMTDKKSLGIYFPSMSQFKHVHYIKMSPDKAFIYALDRSWEISIATVKGLYGLVKSVFHASLPQGMAGPVGIAAMTHSIVAKGSVTGVLAFMALLSLSIGVLNLLPIPALDGGRFFFLLIEAIFQRPVPQAVEEVLHVAMYFCLLALIFVVTANDIYQLISSLF
ncbi:hypothetical protein COB57_04250 [Candidatus Peregrinibacteria bacterium]|nr:MAG: hypothetical protein COB57_04250 [Candidatus Peregrinibacteria bacterium]